MLNRRKAQIFKKMTNVILEEKIFGYNVVMYRVKEENEKRYYVASGLHFMEGTSITCISKFYEVAFEAFRKAVDEIIIDEFSKYKKLHGYE